MPVTCHLKSSSAHSRTETASSLSFSTLSFEESPNTFRWPATSPSGPVTQHSAPFSLGMAAGTAGAWQRQVHGPEINQAWGFSLIYALRCPSDNVLAPTSSHPLRSNLCRDSVLLLYLFVRRLHSLHFPSLTYSLIVGQYDTSARRLHLFQQHVHSRDLDLQIKSQTCNSLLSLCLL